MTEETKEVKQVKSYQLVKVPTGEALAIETPEGELISTELAIVEILNKIDKLVKSL